MKPLNNNLNNTFINALNTKNFNAHIPVWFMRQAGRYLPEYMNVKKQSSFREMSHTPSIMTEITLQPLRRYPLDAAIMFSDILTCLEFMGAPFEFRDSGPKLDNHGIETVLKLKNLDPAKDLNFVGEGIKSIRKNLEKTPLIGFVGAPFTLISYLVEGGTSKEFLETKKFMFSDKINFEKSMSHISQQILTYLKYQIDCGVQAVQLFDSWVGVLSESSYRDMILPHMQYIIKGVREYSHVTPVILYSQPTTHLLSALTETEANALSIDWRTDISYAAKIIPQNMAIQGNLDPVVTTLDWVSAKPYVLELLEKAKKLEILHRYVFNVGHGVTPQTNTETIARIIDTVHSFK